MLQNIINFLVAIIHPELYKAGQLALNSLHSIPEFGMADWAHCWMSVFTATCVISSCIAPAHFDPKENIKYYNALATFGTNKAMLELPDLDGGFQYGAATIVFFSGSLFKQAVLE